MDQCSEEPPEIRCVPIGILEPPNRSIAKRDPRHGHAVLRQCAGLVGTDDRYASERLDGRQPADDRVLPTHLLNANCQDDSHDCRETLRNRRHGEAHRGKKELQCGFARDHPLAQTHLQDPHAEHHGTQTQDHEPQDLAEPGEASLQRRGLVVLSVEHRGNPAELCIHAGPDGDAQATAVGHYGGTESHVHPITQCHAVGIKKDLGVFCHRYRFARERALLNAEISGLNQTKIGRNHAPRLQDHDVARHDLRRLDLHDATVATHEGRRTGHSLQCGQSLLGPALLDQTDDRVQQHDSRDDDSVGQLTKDSGNHRRRE